MKGTFCKMSRIDETQMMEGYLQGQIAEFRALEKKTKTILIRLAMNANVSEWDERYFKLFHTPLGPNEKNIVFFPFILEEISNYK